jgi:hypothetical protein
LLSKKKKVSSEGGEDNISRIGEMMAQLVLGQKKPDEERVLEEAEAVKPTELEEKEKERQRVSRRDLEKTEEQEEEIKRQEREWEREMQRRQDEENRMRRERDEQEREVQAPKPVSKTKEPSKGLGTDPKKLIPRKVVGISSAKDIMSKKSGQEEKERDLGTTEEEKKQEEKEIEVEEEFDIDLSSDYKASINFEEVKNKLKNIIIDQASTKILGGKSFLSIPQKISYCVGISS